MPRLNEHSPAEDLLVEEAVVGRRSVQRRAVIGCIGCRWLTREGAGQDPIFYGYEISKCTGIGTGTLYPILSQLEEAGLIDGVPELIDPAEAGRPARVNYWPGASELSEEFQLRLRIPPYCELESDN
jgi:hypothetical protein